VSKPLTIHHEKIGAKFGSGNIPLEYTNVNEEYWTIKKAAGISDVSYLGRLIITGKDRSSWLNGLVTNDVSQLKENTGIHSVLLNTRARVLADLYIYSLEDSFLLDTGEAAAARVQQLLDQFIISEQVNVKDTSDELVHLTVQGPEAARAVNEVLGVDVKNLMPLQFRRLGPSIIIARNRSGLSGYDIVLPKEESEPVWQGFLLKTGDLGVKPVGARALDILRLEAGLPKYGVDVDENNIVLEAGYKDALSYSKGCYMGQEVVARATHIGRVNKQLVKLDIESEHAVEAKSKLRVQDREAGFVTSSAFSPELKKVVALGYVNRDFAKDDTRLIVESEGRALSALVRGVV